MAKLKILEECETVRSTAEETFRNGGFFSPMIGIFKDREYKGAIILRGVDAEDEEDKACAFAEACMAIGLLGGNTAIVSYDSFVADPNGEPYEAIHVLLATDRGAEAYMMPYKRDEHGKFVDWMPEKEQDDIDPNWGISDNMIQTLAHFMRSGATMMYPEVMLRSLSKRGHMISLPSGEKYLNGILSMREDTKEAEEQRA